ncbi:hypothetical protein CAEBREN_22384 [Caenorhabditis brenneri]|uniref:DUF19 domain-containing protein n=1 Tax=Caenorhabditis brenneri TaxID=135651 RepID=G0NNP5_CAEBE|nr:hypothetical protein CAEBREN_22384 [Caenorhabditis brenneri]
MMKLLLLLFMVGSARSHPLQNECDSENQKALSCQREISKKFGSYFSHGFHVNSQAIAEFKRCFGEPVCTVSTKKLQLLNTKTALYEELVVLSNCLSEDRYRDAKGR